MTTHKLKALALTLVAAYVLSAVVVSAAQANTFTAESFPVEITGEQTTVVIEGKTVERFQFLTAAGLLSCKAVSSSGSATGNSTELTLTTSYTGCTKSGLNATVNMNGCDYLLTAGAFSGGSLPIELHIKCEAGHEIEISLVGTECRTKIPSQTREGTTGQNSAGSPMDITVTTNIPNIEYTVEHGEKCPNKAKDGVHNDGVYKGGLTLTGHKPGSPGTPIGITVS